jgi:hypothetical protein
MVTKATTLEKVRCNECRRRTDHQLLLTAQGDLGSEQYDEDYVVSWQTTFDLLQCCGCREALLRGTYMFSEDEHAEIRYFPPPASRHSPKWARELPYELKVVLDEIYRALDANNRRLTIWAHGL